MSQKVNNFLKISLSAVFMTLVSFFVYFGFANQYSSNTLSLQYFNEQYNSGIYQFRFLSTQAVLWIYDLLSQSGIAFETLPLHFLDHSADAQLYVALFLYNTLFAVLTIIGVAKILVKQNIIITLFIASTIALSQYVIVPYDTFAYFILVLFFGVLINYTQHKSPKSNFVLLCLLVIIGVANRETMALSLAATASVLLVERNVSKDSIIPIAILTAVFLLTYIGLRVVFHSGSTADGFLLGENFSNPKNILGLLFAVVLMAIPLTVARTFEQKKFIVIFYFFSLPYILFCFIVGILFETRLFIPIFLLGMLFSQLSFHRIRFQR